jgi:hypothetical protein
MTGYGIQFLSAVRDDKFVAVPATGTTEYRVRRAEPVPEISDTKNTPCTSTVHFHILGVYMVVPLNHDVADRG